MLNKHIVRRTFVVTVLLSVFAGGANILYHTQAQARQAQELESQRATQRLAQKRAQEQRLNRELICLARNVYFESGSEPYRGKIAVAQVTMNRVNSSKFPASVCDVVHQKTQRPGYTLCQFSWVCEGNKRIRAPQLYEESLRAARQVLLQGHRLPELKGAKYFHADYIEPGWDRPIKAKIGRHIFY